MNYEKLYKEALERAKYWEKNPTVWSSDDICQKIFPELKELDDELTRKEMINFIQETIENVGESPNIWTMSNAKKWLTWLKKQGEQKPAENKDAEQAAKEYREMRERYGVKNPIMLDEIEGAYYEGATREKNPTWSEEDELMFTSTINSLKLTNGVCDMKIDWLKSLKNRVQPVIP